ncbi:unnamed protein product, partial [Menidia menidia]
MMKFQSNSGCPMVIMFSLNRAAVFFMQLFHMRMVFAATSIDYSRNMLAFRGSTVVLTCNISKSNQTKISWTNGRFKFARNNLDTPPSSNFSTKRVRIDPEMPTNLTIFHAHDDDEGIYKCEITDSGGVNSITWNVTVSENHEGSFLSKNIELILPPAAGLFLCCLTSAVCFCFCRNMLAIRGSPVVLTCNISKSNQTKISWTNGRFKFVRGNLDTPPSSNFSTKRVRIDPEMPTNLTILYAHDDDEGIYKCEITDREVVNSITWNVTVSENHEGIVLSKYIRFFWPVAVGLLLCCITSAVFFYM